MRRRWLFVVVCFVVAGTGVGRGVAHMRVGAGVSADARPVADGFQDAGAAKGGGRAEKLAMGEVVARQMSSGETHAFKVSVEGGQYLRVVVRQQGIDVVVALLDTDARTILEMDSMSGAHGAEYVSMIAEKTGDYALELRTKRGRSVTGRYEMRIEELRAAAAEDAPRVAAERAFTEGTGSLAAGTKESRAKALEKFNEALAYWKKNSDPHWEAMTLYSIGTSHRRSGDLQAAAKFYRETLAVEVGADDWRLVASVWNDSGLNYSEAGEHERAVDALNRALKLYAEHQDIRGQGSALINLGMAFNRAYKPREALPYFERALPLRLEEKDWESEANILNAMGGAYQLLGEPHLALEHHVRAQKTLQTLHESKLLREPERLASTFNNIALVYDQLGEWQPAIENYERGLEIFRRGGNSRSMALTLDNIGQLYDVLGDSATALEYLNEALKFSEGTVKDPNTISENLIHIGAVNVSQGKLDEALTFFNRALSLKANDGVQASALTNIGMVRAARGDARGALEAYGEALKLQGNTGGRRKEAATLRKRGEAYSMLGEHDKAREDLVQSLSLSRAVADPLGEAYALNGLARVERDRNNLAESLKLSGEVLSIVESRRTKLASQRLRTVYFASSQNYYETYIDTTMRLYRQTGAQEHAAAALQASERARARSLIDTLVEAGAEIRQGVGDELIGHEREVQQKLNAKARAQTEMLNTRKGTPEQAAAMQKEIDALISDYDRVRAKIRTASPKYAGLTQPPEPTLPDIQQRLLDADTLLLEYSLGEEKSYLWLVSQTGITGHELPGRAKIEAVARRLYELLTAPQPEASENAQARRRRITEAAAEYDARATELSEMLLRPVARELGKKRLLIVSDGVLQYIPFNALPKPADVRVAAVPQQRSVNTPAARVSYLIEHHEVVSLPSVTTILVMQREMEKRVRTPLTVAVFADPIFDENDPRLQLARKGRTRPATDGNVATGNVAAENVADKKVAVEKVADGNGDAGRAATRAPAVRSFRSALDLRPLPLTRDEAEAIKAAAAPGRSTVALGFEANRAAVSGLVPGKYGVVHFATHGLLDSEHPELSGIVLSMYDERGEAQDGILRLHDIYNLKMPVELVVLSACSTGLGSIIKGEGLVGLTRGFMYAGAPRVVASLWRVDDLATSLLMGRFYENMLGGGMSPTAALRRAQMDMLREKRWQSPYYWSAFMLQGDWRRIG